MKKYTENSLVILLKRRDRDAFEHLVLSYSSLFMAKANLYCRNRQDAEDSVQDSLVIIYQKLTSFSGDNLNAFISWCVKIVINNSLSKYRRSYFTFERNELTELTDVHIAPTVYSSIGKEELMNLIQQLPEGYKQIFSLFAIEGYSHKEIAQIMEITPSTSRSQYIRAKKKIKEKMINLSPTNMAYEV